MNLRPCLSKIGSSVFRAVAGREGQIGIVLERDARYIATMLGVLAAGEATCLLMPVILRNAIARSPFKPVFARWSLLDTYLNS